MSNLMKFDEFKDAVVGKIREYLPETFKDAECRLHVVTKNNNLQLTGLTITAGNRNISPTIYLEQFFEAYEKGEDINVILRQIAETRISHEFTDTFDVGTITDFKRCKKNIIPRLIGKSWNEELLRTRPHKEISDLAVTYCIFLGENGDGSMSAPVSNELMATWGVSVDEIHDIAIQNMKTVTPATFATMGSVIGNMLLDDMPRDMTEEEREAALAGVGFQDDAMYVLTNKQKMHGAAQLLDKDVMDGIVEKVGKDFFILPSSIHEVLIVPATHDMEVSMLENMVKEVNETQVSLEERLSDHVYVYQNGELHLAK